MTYTFRGRWMRFMRLGWMRFVVMMWLVRLGLQMIRITITSGVRRIRGSARRIILGIQVSKPLKRRIYIYLHAWEGVEGMEPVWVGAAYGDDEDAAVLEVNGLRLRRPAT